MSLGLIEMEHLPSDHVAKAAHRDLGGVQPAKASSRQAQ